MSYVGSPFKHDVFVSYSHGDSAGTGNSRLQAWSEAFAEELTKELRVLPNGGAEFSIFLDNSGRPGAGIDPMEALTRQLQGEVAMSASLLVLMSPHYLGSKWCGAERQWWYEKQSELELPVDGRIAIARIWRTDEAWPEHLCDATGVPLPGFFFYDRESEELTPRPWEWPAPGPNSRDPFRKELLRLVGCIVVKLDELKTRMETRRNARESTDKLAAPSGQVVYLHGRTDYSKAWDRAATTLTASGFTVFPSEPDPLASDPKTLQKLRSERVQIMSECDALLLVAGENGRTVDQDLVVVGRRDRNSARALSQRLLPCALLDSTGGSVATPLRRVTAKSMNVEWIDSTHDPWTPAVQHWLHETARSEATT